MQIIYESNKISITNYYRFCIFNDDIFIIKPVTEKDFFVNGLPVDNPVLGTNIPVRGEKGFGSTGV